MLNTDGVVMANVTFEPGCRNNWHIHHGGGQILLCTDGEGWYQEWGGRARKLRPATLCTSLRRRSTGTERQGTNGSPMSPRRCRRPAGASSGSSRYRKKITPRSDKNVKKSAGAPIWRAGAFYGLRSIKMGIIAGSIILSLDLEIGLGMSADGADLGSGLADDYVAAVGALPYGVSVS